MSMRERFSAVTNDLIDADPRVALVLADIGAGEFGAAAHRHPSRVVNVGIREQLMVGVAAGLAREGLRPIVHSYAPFLIERAYEQIKLDLGHQDLGAVLVSVGGSFDASSEGRTHQAPEDVAVLGALPGWDIYVPGHPDELETLLRHAVSGKGRAYVRLSASANRNAVAVRPGEFAVVRTGSRSAVTIVAVGPMLDPVLEATPDIDATVLYATTVRPFDRSTLRRQARSGDVIVVEPYLAGTSAHEVASAFEHQPHRQLSLGVPSAEHRHYGEASRHAEAHGLDAAGIGRSVRRFLDAAGGCFGLHVA